MSLVRTWKKQFMYLSTIFLAQSALAGSVSEDNNCLFGLVDSLNEAEKQMYVSADFQIGTRPDSGPRTVILQKLGSNTPVELSTLPATLRHNQRLPEKFTPPKGRRAQKREAILEYFNGNFPNNAPLLYAWVNKKYPGAKDGMNRWEAKQADKARNDAIKKLVSNHEIPNEEEFKRTTAHQLINGLDLDEQFHTQQQLTRLRREASLVGVSAKEARQRRVLVASQMPSSREQVYACEIPEGFIHPTFMLQPLGIRMASEVSWRDNLPSFQPINIEAWSAASVKLSAAKSYAEISNLAFQMLYGNTFSGREPEALDKLQSLIQKDPLPDGFPSLEGMYSEPRQPDDPQSPVVLLTRVIRAADGIKSRLREEAYDLAGINRFQPHSSNSPTAVSVNCEPANLSREFDFEKLAPLFARDPELRATCSSSRHFGPLVDDLTHQGIALTYAKDEICASVECSLKSQIVNSPTRRVD